MTKRWQSWMWDGCDDNHQNASAKTNRTKKMYGAYRFGQKILSVFLCSKGNICGKHMTYRAWLLLNGRLITWGAWVLPARVACEQAFGRGRRGGNWEDRKAIRPEDKPSGPPFHGTRCASDSDVSSYLREHWLLTLPFLSAPAVGT